MSDNVQVSATEIKEEVAAMREATNAQKSVAQGLKAQFAAIKAENNAMIAMDKQIFDRRHVRDKTVDENGRETPAADDYKQWKLIVEPADGLEKLETEYSKFEEAYSQFENEYNSFMEILKAADESADIIADQLNQATDALGETPTPTPTEDPTYPPGPGGSPYGGDPGSGQSPYSPPTTQTKKEEKDEKDEKDDTDYGDGDEGEEKEPNVSQPITTTSPITTTTPTTTTTPASTQSTTTTNGTVQTPAASTEQHVGGGYSGSGGFSYDSTQTDTDEEQLEQQAASSIDNIINGRAAPKIPTSSAPIAKAQAARTTGSSVIPAASGLAAAAVIGLGAKAFLDKKKETEEEEEEEMFS